MTDYTAMRWPAADAGAAGTADRTTAWLVRHGWWVAIDLAGWRVMIDGADARSSLQPSADEQTILIGRLFDRAATDYGRVPEPIFPSSSPSFRALARTLATRGWGAYVAIGIDDTDPDRMSIFRDPIGALDCVTWRANGVRIVSSAPEFALMVARPPDLGIDWTRLASLLAFPASVSESLPISGLHAVPAGVLVECRKTGIEEDRLWRPASFCAPLPATTQDPARRLEWLVDSCVAAWCTGIRNGVAELSGGLDSAIVAAAAARTRPTSVHHWFHYSSDDRAGDESMFAQAVADHLALPFTAVVRAERRLDPAAIGSMPAPARPGLGGVSLFHDRDLASRLDAFGADALLTGHGGDAVFFQPATPLIAVDLWSDGRSLAERLSALKDIAVWTRTSFWKVARAALKHRVRHSPLATPATAHAFLGQAADASQHRSPWLDDVAKLPPAKQLQIWMIANSRSAFGASWCSQGRQMIHPLLSQPLIEHVLAIPAIDLTFGRRERALARAAFSRRLPAMLVDRHGKGDLTLYFGRLLAGSTAFLRDYLLDGQLAAHRAIDRPALETILTPDILMQQDHYSELMTAVVVEHWARAWTGKLADSDAQRGPLVASHALPAGSKWQSNQANMRS